MPYPNNAWEFSIHVTGDAREVTRVRFPFPPGQYPPVMEFARDGSALALAHLGGTDLRDLTISAWDLPSGRERFSIVQPDWGRLVGVVARGQFPGLRFLPDGSKIALCRLKDRDRRSLAFSLEIRDSRTGAVLRSFETDAPAEPGNPQFLRTDPDGGRLVVAGR